MIKLLSEVTVGDETPIAKRAQGIETCETSDTVFQRAHRIIDVDARGIIAVGVVARCNAAGICTDGQMSRRDGAADSIVDFDDDLLTRNLRQS